MTHLPGLHRRPSPRYIYVMPGCRFPHGRGRRAPALRAALCWVAAGALAACSERERFVFEAPSDGVGPVAVIEDPGTDSVVRAGPAVSVGGTIRDDDGIDTLYVETEGGVSQFAPILGLGQPSFRFAVPITTNGLVGAEITVRVFGTDLLGNRGETATRKLTVGP